MANKETFCVLSWVAQHVSTTGEIAPCCEYDGVIGTVEKDGLLAAWDSKSLRSLRQQLDTGVKAKGCWKCFERENTEGNSLRLGANKKFDKWASIIADSQNASEVSPKRPIAYDLRLSNLCNFKCRSCWHGASSKWFMDAKALGQAVGDKAEIRSFKSEGEVQQHFADGIDTIEEIYFAGGEPIMMGEHYKILEMLLDKGRNDVKLSYTTNLSALTFGKRNIVELWKEFPNISVEASIDAPGERGSFMRNGFDWNTWAINLETVQKECPHIDILYGITVSVMNIMILTDLLRELHDRFGASPWQLQMHSLQEPTHFRTQILPTAMKKQVHAKFKKFQAEMNSMNHWEDGDKKQVLDKFHGLLSFMDAEDRSYELAGFREASENLDGLRGENTQNTLPELSGLWRQASFRERLKGLFKS